MLILIRMAWTNLFRSPRRTLLTSSGVAVGVLGALLFYGFMLSSYWGVANAFTRSGDGHIQVGSATYFDSPNKEMERAPIRTLESLRQAILSEPELSARIKASTPRRKFFGTISHEGEESLFLLGTGVHPEEYEILTDWLGLVEGEGLSPDAPDTVLLGQSLASKLGAKPGDKIQIQVATDKGRPNLLHATVSGLVVSRSADHDEQYVVMNLDAALGLLEAENADTLIVGLKEGNDTDFAWDRIRSLIDKKGFAGLAVKKWDEIAQYYLSVKSLYDRIFGFVLTILAIIAVFSVANAIMMSVNERSTEIGMLRSIGATDRQIAFLFACEGFFTGVLGAAMGLLCALAVSQAIEAFGGIPMPPPPGDSEGYSVRLTFDREGALVVCGLTLLIALVASCVPAALAGRRNIARTLSGL